MICIFHCGDDYSLTLIGLTAFNTTSRQRNAVTAIRKPRVPSPVKIILPSLELNNEATLYKDIQESKRAREVVHPQS